MDFTLIVVEWAKDDKKAPTGLFISREGILSASKMLHLNATVAADKPR